MDSKEFAARLAIGSDSIDRMCSEIKSTIGIIRSTLNGDSEALKAIRRGEYPCETCTWHLGWFIEGWDENYFVIQCTIDGQEVFTANGEKKWSIEARFVQRAYEGIPTLLDVIRNKYPNFDTKVAFIINASFVYQK